MSTTHHDELVASPPASPPEKGASRASWRRWFDWAPEAGSSAAVIVVLCSLLAWGHSTDWTMPTFSSLIGQKNETVDDWCKQHNVPESQCIECNKSLVPAVKDYGWCIEHGIAQCPLHHPDVAQLKATPKVSPEQLDRASAALALRPRGENNSTCKNYQRRIQFASKQAIEKVGVDVFLTQTHRILETISANAEAVYDQTRMAHLSSRVGGTAWRVEKKVGDQVHKGDVLALIDSAEVGRVKGEFLQAVTQFRLKQTQFERIKPLGEKGSISGRSLLEAETAFHEARLRVNSTQQALVNLGFVMKAEDFAVGDVDDLTRKIQFLGLSPQLISTLDPSATTSNLYPLKSSLDGIVIERNVVEGEVLDTTRVLFSVADRDRLWLIVNVRQDDVQYLSSGQLVLFRPNDRMDAPEAKGTIAWISSSVDDRSRTVKVRVDLPNQKHRLRANTFGTGRIVLREEASAVVIPDEALHWDGCCHVVFVRDKNYFQEGSPKFFHIRSVRSGVREGGMTEIIAGLLPGEVIASKNSVVLEAELLKANLGAGCCEACIGRKK